MPRTRLVFAVALAAALLCVGVPTAALAQNMTLHSTETTNGKPSDVTTYMTANALRRNSSDGNDFIVKLDEGKLITIDNKKKTYSEVTLQQLQDMMATLTGGQNLPPEAVAMMKKMMGGSGSGDFTVTKVGPGETIAGYATDKYEVTGPMNMEIMAAPDLKAPPQYWDALRARMPANPLFDMGQMFEQMKKINGWPMKQTTTMKIMGRETTSTNVVNSVDKSPIPASTFDPPAGYRKVDFAM
jgi:hypothetical protein